MSRSLCLDEPERFEFESEVLAADVGKVLLRQSWFYPGGGGQLPDRGWLVTTDGEAQVTGVELRGGHLWHVLDRPITPSGAVQGRIDRTFRTRMSQLHTTLHILNALVYQTFDGALVTGVQMSSDGTARVDFDLPDVDHQRLRALEAAANDVIAADLPVRATYASRQRLADEPGLLRSRSVAPPPQPDGSVRIVEIAGLDQQACGGTHLASTGASPPVRILKIENKGRHNRRLRIGLL